MRLEYYPETDTLYIELQEGPGTDAQEVAPNIVLDFNAAGEVIGIEIEHASERTDLKNFQLASFPIGKAPFSSLTNDTNSSKITPACTVTTFVSLSMVIFFKF